jgi:tRNA nucleotidyltransferase/poly(A) polymerase
MSLEGDILDFQAGITDLGTGLIRFIGDPQTRLDEDPLRLLRAIRLSLQLDFTIEEQTRKAIQKNFSALATLKQSQIETEIKKLDPNLQKSFVDIINAKDLT